MAKKKLNKLVLKKISEHFKTIIEDDKKLEFLFCIVFKKAKSNLILFAFKLFMIKNKFLFLYFFYFFLNNLSHFNQVTVVKTSSEDIF
jgi:hypothetical protein